MNVFTCLQLTDVIYSFGGMLGLWMGFSVITIIELVGLTMLMALMICAKMRGPKSMDSDNDQHAAVHSALCNMNSQLRTRRIWMKSTMCSTRQIKIRQAMMTMTTVTTAMTNPSTRTRTMMTTTTRALSRLRSCDDIMDGQVIRSFTNSTILTSSTRSEVVIILHKMIASLD